MQVKDVIKLLQKYPQDMEVVVADYEFMIDTETYEIVDDHVFNVNERKSDSGKYLRIE
jgi:hypothetical protein